MNTKSKNSRVPEIIIFLVAAFLSAGMIFLTSGGKYLPLASLFAAFVILASFVIIMSVELKKSLDVTLYSYKNIMLVGGILFVSIMALVQFSYAISFLIKNGETEVNMFADLMKFPRQFSYYATFVIVVLCVLLGVSNIALMRHEGFRPRNAWSVVIAAFYIGGTALIYAFTDVLDVKAMELYNEGGNTALIWLNTTVPVFFLLMLCYFECVLAGTAIMGWKAARQVPKYDKDFIIILGCSIDKKGGLLPLLRGRVNRAMRYAWDQEICTGKPLKYIPSGGKGTNEVLSEGSAMELYLLSKGAEPYEIIAEKESTTTEENFIFSKKIIDSLKPDAKIAFATTNYHMLRSGIFAQRAGIDAEGIAGDTKWYFWPNGFIREFFGILVINIKAHITVALLVAALSIALGALSTYLFTL